MKSFCSAKACFFQQKTSTFTCHRLDKNISFKQQGTDHNLTLLHSEQPKLYRVLAILSALGLNSKSTCLDEFICHFMEFTVPRPLSIVGP